MQAALKIILSAGAVFVLCGAAVAFLATSAGATGSPSYVITSDPSQVPTRPDVTVAHLSGPPSAYISAAAAVRAAEANFGVSNSDVLRVVEVSISGSSTMNEQIPAWVAVVNDTTPAPVSGYWQQLAIVVNASTGKFAFAYPSDLYVPPAPAGNVPRSGPAGHLVP